MTSRVVDNEDIVAESSQVKVRKLTTTAVRKQAKATDSQIYRELIFEREDTDSEPERLAEKARKQEEKKNERSSNLSKTAPKKAVKTAPKKTAKKAVRSTSPLTKRPIRKAARKRKQVVEILEDKDKSDLIAVKSDSE